MSDYIRREAAIALADHFRVFGRTGLVVPVDALKKLPAADVRPVVYGHWLTWEEQFPGRKVPKKSRLGVFCSACHNHADNMTDFCPNCGADMREEHDG